jgi:hypothetical protein
MCVCLCVCIGSMRRVAHADSMGNGPPRQGGGILAPSTVAIFRCPVLAGTVLIRARGLACELCRGVKRDLEMDLLRS